MPTPIILDHNQMAILYEKYTELARSAFGYLNGRVNKYNICMLRLEHYDINVYADDKISHFCQSTRTADNILKNVTFAVRNVI